MAGAGRRQGTRSPPKELRRAPKRISYGSLLNETLLREELDSASEPAGEEVRDRLLVFWPVGGTKAARDLVVENVAQLEKFQDPRLPRPLRVDVFLAHYDGRRDSWKEAVGASWYDAHVRYSLEYQALKIWMAKDIFLSKLNGTSPELNSYGINISSYEYLWLVDEDADFNHVDVRLMVDLARESGSGIVTPAFTTMTRGGRGARARALHQLRQSSETGEIVRAGEVGKIGGSGGSGGESRDADGGLSRCQYNDTLCRFQSPKPQCRFRYVDFVEVSFALMRPAVFRAVLEGCPGCIPTRRSIWGLDHVWCAVANWNSRRPMRSCAVLDATPIIHQNFKTLPTYGDRAAHNSYIDESSLVWRQVHASLRGLWRDPKDMQCVPAGDGTAQ